MFVEAFSFKISTNPQSLSGYSFVGNIVSKDRKEEISRRFYE